MAAAHDLKLCGVIRVGSSPTPGTSIKLSGILPTNSAARCAASYGKMGFPRASRAAKRRFEIPCDFYEG